MLWFLMAAVYIRTALVLVVVDGLNGTVFGMKAGPVDDGAADAGGLFLGRTHRISAFDRVSQPRQDGQSTLPELTGRHDARFRRSVVPRAASP